MKKISVVLLAVFMSVVAIAQSEKDVIAASELTWFGIDFSKAQFVGSFNQFAEAGEKGGDQIKHTFFPAWNDVVANEREKYDLKKAYNKTSINYDLDVVTKRNAAVDADKLVTLNSDEGRITKEEIAKVVSQYKSTKKGVGLVYIVDTYSKAEERGVIWVTFFDIATRKVLIAEKFTGKPGGFGLRNYWMKPVFEVMMKTSHEAYRNWEKIHK
jgi:hypothetical protein